MCTYEEKFKKEGNIIDNEQINYAQQNRYTKSLTTPLILTPLGVSGVRLLRPGIFRDNYNEDHVEFLILRKAFNEPGTRNSNNSNNATTTTTTTTTTTNTNTNTNYYYYY